MKKNKTPDSTQILEDSITTDLVLLSAEFVSVQNKLAILDNSDRDARDELNEKANAHRIAQQSCEATLSMNQRQRNIHKVELNNLRQLIAPMIMSNMQVLEYSCSKQESTTMGISQSDTNNVY